VAIPTTLDGALDAGWLGRALDDLGDGDRIEVRSSFRPLR
jgi:hypothetical protein